MKLFRHAFFAFLLLLTQTGALTHAVEHLHPDADTPPHTCALCIAVQGLDAALASTPPDMALSTADFAAPAGAVIPVFSPSVVVPRARAPPVA